MLCVFYFFYNVVWVAVFHDFVLVVVTFAVFSVPCDDIIVIPDIPSRVLPLVADLWSLDPQSLEETPGKGVSSRRTLVFSTHQIKEYKGISSVHP